MQISLKSDIGLVRKRNEDYADYCVHNNNVLAVVCDGMGGHVAGNIASRTVVDTLIKLFQADDFYQNSKQEIVKKLTSYIKLASEALKKMSAQDKRLSSMGTTCVMMAIINNHALFVNVGDSRAYFLWNNNLTQVTEDHNLAQKLFKEKLITKEELKTHKGQHALTSSIGPVKNLKVDVFEVPLFRGIVMLSTDGIHGQIESDHIKSILLEPISIKEMGEKLVNVANHNGGRDNATVLLIKL